MEISSKYKHTRNFGFFHKDFKKRNEVRILSHETCPIIGMLFVVYHFIDKLSFRFPNDN